MPNVTVAEWLLSRFMSRTQAASIVGDIVESGGNKGDLHFWSSFFPVLCSMSLRGCIAYAAALGLGLFSHDFLHSLVFTANAAHQPPHGGKFVLDFVCLVSVLLSFAVPYLAIRFGLNDAFTQQVIFAWGLACVFSVYWWIPAVSVVCIVLTAANVISSIISTNRRRTVLAFFVALGISSAVAAFFGEYLTEWFARSPQPLLKQLAFTIYTLGWVIQPAIYSRVGGIFSTPELPRDVQQAAI
jgi:hypothetical protein